jgi:predicted TIM-barrel fold metal-dependent hydrolase
MVERVDALNRLRAEISTERIVFGSHLPLFNVESALLKVQEAGLSGTSRDAILSGNARRLLAR